MLDKPTSVRTHPSGLIQAHIVYNQRIWKNTLVLASLLSGILAGALKFEGWSGFILFPFSYLLSAFCLLCCTSLEKVRLNKVHTRSSPFFRILLYFPDYMCLLEGRTLIDAILTYVTFWTLVYSSCYVFIST